MRESVRDRLVVLGTYAGECYVMYEDGGWLPRLNASLTNWAEITAYVESRMGSGSFQRIRRFALGNRLAVVWGIRKTDIDCGLYCSVRDLRDRDERGVVLDFFDLMRGAIPAFSLERMRIHVVGVIPHQDGHFALVTAAREDGFPFHKIDELEPFGNQDEMMTLAARDYAAAIGIAPGAVTAQSIGGIYREYDSQGKIVVESLVVRVVHDIPLLLDTDTYRLVRRDKSLSADWASWFARLESGVPSYFTKKAGSAQNMLRRIRDPQKVLNEKFAWVRIAFGMPPR